MSKEESIDRFATAMGWLRGDDFEPYHMGPATDQSSVLFWMLLVSLLLNVGVVLYFCRSRRIQCSSEKSRRWHRDAASVDGFLPIVNPIRRYHLPNTPIVLHADRDETAERIDA